MVSGRAISAVSDFSRVPSRRPEVHEVSLAIDREPTAGAIEHAGESVIA